MAKDATCHDITDALRPNHRPIQMTHEETCRELRSLADQLAREEITMPAWCAQVKALLADLPLNASVPPLVQAYAQGGYDSTTRTSIQPDTRSLVGGGSQVLRPAPVAGPGGQ